MNAIRKIVKRVGNELKIVLPDDFKSEEFEVIVLPAEEKVSSENEFDLDAYRQSIMDYYAKFHVDFGNYKFNRDELYDR
jgi:hypothetical protein